MKIATWNVNSIKMREERVLKFLKRESPDFLCLQELKGIDENFPYASFEEAGYFSSVFGQKAYNGVAILSKAEPLKIIRGFDDKSEDTAARAITAEFDGLHVISAYIPNGQEVGSEKYTYKLDWLKRLKRFLDKRFSKKSPLILAGDFNIAPDDRDVYDPAAWKGKILCSDVERAALCDIVDFGFTDTYRLHHSEAGQYSWWDYRDLGFPKNKGLRIDLVLASEALAKKCKGARIDRDERKGQSPSDHVPVMAEFS